MIARLPELDPDKLSHIFEVLAGFPDIAGRIIIDSESNEIWSIGSKFGTNPTMSVFYVKEGRAKLTLSRTAERTGRKLELAIYVPDEGWPALVQLIQEARIATT